MRAGEIRGLKWASIDFENNRIQIERNFVEGDGEKAPKRDSSGGVPLAEPLREPLQALRALAFKLGRYSVNEYVLFAIDSPGKPILKSMKWLCARANGSALNDSTARRRPPAARQSSARHLTLHGGRHFALLFSPMK